MGIANLGTQTRFNFRFELSQRLPGRHLFAEAEKKQEPSMRWFLRGLVLVAVLLSLAFAQIISPGGLMAPNLSSINFKALLRPSLEE